MENFIDYFGTGILVFLLVVLGVATAILVSNLLRRVLKGRHPRQR